MARLDCRDQDQSWSRHELARLGSKYDTFKCLQVDLIIFNVEQTQQGSDHLAPDPTEKILIRIRQNRYGSGQTAAEAAVFRQGDPLRNMEGFTVQYFKHRRIQRTWINEHYR